MSKNRCIFRIWDKLSKQYRYSGYVCLVPSKNNPSLFVPEYDNFKLERWTGMIDFEGKEIFEGDVVEGIGSVTGKGQKGKVVWNNNLSCYELIDIDAPTVFCENERKNFVVVGNINERKYNLSKENERLRDALEKIVEKVKTAKIRAIAEEALKGKEDE